MKSFELKLWQTL